MGLKGLRKAYYEFMYDGETCEEKKRKLNIQPKKKESKLPVRETLNANAEGLEEEEDNSVEFFKGDEHYIAEIVDVSSLRDDKMQKYSKPLKGKELLSRDFKGTPLFIERNGSFLKIDRAFRVNKEGQEEEERFVYLETEYEDFVIRFEVEILF